MTRFLFRLALALGKTVAELRQGMTAEELHEWMAYYEIDPFGNDRADLNSAIVASTMANCHRGKTQRPYKPADFMPKFDQVKHEQPIEDMIAVAEAAARAINGS